MYNPDKYDTEKNNIKCRFYRERNREKYRLKRREYMREYVRLKAMKKKIFKDEAQRLMNINI